MIQYNFFNACISSSHPEGIFAVVGTNSASNCIDACGMTENIFHILIPDSNINSYAELIPAKFPADFIYRYTRFIIQAA